MFNLAIQWGWRTDNPAAGFKKRVETARERFLSHEEIGRLAEVLDAAEDQRAAGIIRICMLTGSRVGEVRQAQFEQFNLELGIWSKARGDHQTAQDPPGADLGRCGGDRAPAGACCAQGQSLALSR